jgi:UDP-glucuronate 4-epimerase
MEPDPSSSPAPYKIYNIGNNSPVKLIDFITAIEEATGKTSVRNLMPMQPGDVPVTWADVDDLAKNMGYRPGTDIRKGVAEFVKWYREYYSV